MENMTIRSAIGWTIFIFIFLYIDNNFFDNYNPFENDFIRLTIRFIILSFTYIGIPLILGKLINNLLEKYYLTAGLKEYSFNAENYFDPVEPKIIYNREQRLRRILLRINAFQFIFCAIILFFFEKHHTERDFNDELQSVEGYNGMALFLLIMFGLMSLYLSFTKSYNYKENIEN